MRSLLPYVIVMFVLLGTLNISAQQWPDSKGRDFWFSFLPNFHNSEDEIEADPVLQREHQLYIYIGAERPTSGTISWTRSDGTTQTLPFRINDVRQLFSTSVYYRDVELRGVSDNGVGFDFFSSDNESVSPKSFHVVADDDVTVYALNQATLTSDAFLILPTDAVAEDYVVLAYTSDIRYSGIQQQSLDPNSTPSQFAVVATADSTIVDITPSVPTVKNPNMIRQRVILQQGESYLVQADMRIGGKADLTGTLVRASLPVAVFAGHQRTVLPLSFIGTLGSRDCLVEQMNPIRTWGKSAFLTPLARSSDEVAAGYDLFRVVAAFDSTAVIVDGQERTILDAGMVFEDSLVTAREVRTSRPALAAQYKKTSSVGGGGSTRSGDPFMMLVPPAEQFMKSYRFINIQSYTYTVDGNGIIVVDDSIYKEQWMNVVIPTTGIPSLLIDGVSVPQGRFQQIGTTSFSWAQIPLTDGTHEVRSDTTFGIYVYGYGVANSYGYIGGMSFRPLDVNPPALVGENTCNGFEGEFTDSLLADTRITRVGVVPGTEVNATFTVPAFTPPQAVVPFSAALRDIYLDGSLSVEATDAVDQTSRFDIVLPGFTVAPVGSRNAAQPLQRAYVIPIDRERCDSFEIENYGLYAHTISALRFSGTTTVTSPQAPFTLLPGQRITVRFCRTGTMEQVVIDTLLVGDTCLLRPVLAAQIEEKFDKEGPKVQGEADVCSTRVDVRIDDEVGADLGLREARILDSVLVNCIVELQDSSTLVRTYRIDVLDPYLDAIYGFEAIDSADNITRFIDTIPGFMMSINGDLSPVTTFDMGLQAIGTLTCDTIDLVNQGVQSISLPTVYVQENLFFSTPQQQFSIRIDPLGGGARLIVCFEPLAADTTAVLSDTIEIYQGCLVRKIVVVGRGKGLEYAGISRCNVPVDATTTTLIGGVTVVPQPANEWITLVLSQPAETVEVRLVDISGMTVLQRTWHGAATEAVLLDVAGVPPGAYGCHVITPNGVANTVCVIR
ncbi:MAG: IgGFc-binding protein [Ignavibacteria bacterium]|nr:IgGFc-binding protein [Ignavibacteria bacterium]